MSGNHVTCHGVPSTFAREHGRVSVSTSNMDVFLFSAIQNQERKQKDTWTFEAKQHQHLVVMSPDRQQDQQFNSEHEPSTGTGNTRRFDFLLV